MKRRGGGGVEGKERRGAAIVTMCPSPLPFFSLYFIVQHMIPLCGSMCQVLWLNASKDTAGLRMRVMRVIPNLSAIVFFFHRVGRPWEDILMGSNPGPTLVAVMGHLP